MEFWDILLSQGVQKWHTSDRTKENLLLQVIYQVFALTLRTIQTSIRCAVPLEVHVSLIQCVYNKLNLFGL